MQIQTWIMLHRISDTFLSIAGSNLMQAIRAAVGGKKQAACNVSRQANITEMGDAMETGRPPKRSETHPERAKSCSAFLHCSSWHVSSFDRHSTQDHLARRARMQGDGQPAPFFQPGLPRDANGHVMIQALPAGAKEAGSNSLAGPISYPAAVGSSRLSAQQNAVPG